MHVRIISLDEIAKPDLTKFITSLAIFITEKQQNKTEAAIKKIKADLMLLLAANHKIITQFNSGQISENDFDKEMIQSIYERTKIKLSIYELHILLRSANPTYETYKDLLDEILKYNKQENQEVICLGLANPKDMRQLMINLQKNNIPYELDENGQLNIIDSMLLITTYTQHQSKEELLLDIIEQYRRLPGNLHNARLFHYPAPEIKCIGEDFKKIPLPIGVELCTLEEMNIFKYGRPSLTS